MFGFDFLLAPLLWALPLAGLPVALHLLFRRKSPVVPFSTLRFIRSSLQHTAARRRVQRWALLICRIVLLAILLFALAQPFKIFAAGWNQPGRVTFAAIVVDTSYSMQLQDNGPPLLDRADAIVQELLRGAGSERPGAPASLKDAKVAIFRSQGAPENSPETFLPASEILGNWTPLKPQPALVPLSQRVEAAMDLLSRQKADQKILVVVSDCQTREFVRPIARLQTETEDVRVVFFDLHPETARSAGITSVGIEPQNPIPGVLCQAVVDVAGRGGDSRAVTLEFDQVDGSRVASSPEPVIVSSFDKTGQVQVRFDLPQGIPVDAQHPQQFVQIRAKLPEDKMAWDNDRSTLVELPSRQNVTMLGGGLGEPTRFARLALDPWEGKVAAWPLAVKESAQLTGQEQTAVALLSQWPDEAHANQMQNFVRGGNTLILFLQPGLEESWGKLTGAQKVALTALLPAAPLTGQAASGAFHAIGGEADALTKGLFETEFRLKDLGVRRFVPLGKPTEGSVTALINLAAVSPEQASQVYSLLLRRSIGAGNVYTWTTLPDPMYANLPTHPLFLPLMVRIAMRSGGHLATNSEIGQPLALHAANAASLAGVQVVSPDKAVHEFQIAAGAEGNPFVWDESNRQLLYRDTAKAGIYMWRNAGKVVALGNVQLPAAESALQYKPADQIVKPGANVIIASSFEQYLGTVSKATSPDPHWSMLIALVLLLLCAEALLGNLSQLWKPSRVPSFAPGAGA